MARREALLRLHKRLLARRNALRKVLATELADLRGTIRGDMSGDAADAAFDSGSGEITSQLAELEARELAQVERALSRLKQGTYGLCEVCGKRIPVARLNALPYSTSCIECQRELESRPGWDLGARGDWEKVYDTHASFDDHREVTISDLELDVGSGGGQR